ncbi:vesicle coat component [Dimargaris cristalligena]|uniref:Emp24/gp25L/p24 family/GOLD-domain-containing protein n=1 Tax=Dimargaris cristalligena TaxID=215637 RepID=A0A4P9ZR69_9FUNG|nr:vesicle coat component [Dimargaris cristalligena]RKP35835.1 emp24/gp25L/p24 family/GOLD-domain-containing protein [Dimargaris cristalligena]|eukprot:RKP35835.1 emp24/gp25L/p24 family/GOLD-domain-containing protein [Dimargaris cristalligena]
MRFPTISACLILGTLVGTSLVQAIKFDMPAFPDALKEEKCLSNWGPQNTKVKVKVKTTAAYGQNLQLRIYDNSASSNVFATRKGINEDLLIEFHTHEHAQVFVCFRNLLEEGAKADGRLRTVTFSMDVGASAIDFKEMAAQEKLKPLEAELVKLEKYLEEVDDQMAYMKRRESKLRNTNESTNERIKFLSVLSLVVLGLSGLWQVYYLRRFFQQKKLI